MNAKKTVAKEFLILITCILLPGLLYLATMPYNYYYHKKSLAAQKEIIPIREKRNNLSTDYRRKISNQKQFYLNIIENFGGQSKYKSFRESWDRLHEIYASDSIIYKWNNTWNVETINQLNQFGIIKAEDFRQYIKDNTLNSQDSLNRGIVDSLYSVIQKKENIKKSYWSNILSKDDQEEFAYKSFGIIAAIAFPLRYLILAIMWSVKTLRSKE